MKALIALVTATLALTGCNSMTGPDDREEAARLARAKRSLEAASPAQTPSARLAAN